MTSSSWRAPQTAQRFHRRLAETWSVSSNRTPLGTGHALATAVIAVPPESQHVLVVNGDVPLVRKEDGAEALAALHERRRATATLLCCSMEAAFAQQIGRLQRGARGKPIGVLEADDTPMPRKGRGGGERRGCTPSKRGGFAGP